MTRCKATVFRAIYFITGSMHWGSIALYCTNRCQVQTVRPGYQAQKRTRQMVLFTNLRGPEGNYLLMVVNLSANMIFLLIERALLLLSDMAMVL